MSVCNIWEQGLQQSEEFEDGFSRRFVRMPPNNAVDADIEAMQLQLDACNDDDVDDNLPKLQRAGKGKAAAKQKAKSRKPRVGFQWCPGCDQQKPADASL